MTWDEMRTLQEPQRGELAGLECMRVISGSCDLRAQPYTPDEFRTLTGRVLFRPEKRMDEWRWKEFGAASKADAKRWPSWDGIHDGDQVTLGHVDALKRGGWLKD